MTLLNIGVIGTSLKENEHRVPIHPKHINWLSNEIREHLVFESDYGMPFNMDNDKIASLSCGLAERDEILESCDIILIPKPMQKDFNMMKEEGILWGWPHCVQQKEIAQSAIEKHLTLIAWEAMHIWETDDKHSMHIFYKNNELAGYAGVLDALHLVGLDGHYGSLQKVIVISFGSVSRGAIYALQGRGFNNITVFTRRVSHLVGDTILGVKYRQIKYNEIGDLMVITPSGISYPFIEEITSADIIVNGILQNTDNPLMFIKEDEIEKLKNGCLIIDISCDLGMGFPFAKPTTFEAPMFRVGNTNYYGVDHTPSYLWNSATWEISKSLIPFLPIVMAGPDKWNQNTIIKRAIEIRSGVIQNPKILSFQKRSAEYPHLIK